MTDLVIGGNGNLGRHLLTRLPSAISTSRDGRSGERLDIRNREQVLEVVGRTQPRCVINTAAMTSVDGCERDEGAAHAIHVEGTANLVHACEQTGSRLIHMSTNYVFDGDSGPYGEDDAPNPLSVYGRTKLESEGLVTGADCAGLVVRTAVFYGPEFDKPNFVTWALRELLLNHEVRIVTDEWANPTHVPELSEAIISLAGSPDTSGVIHAAGNDFLSRYDMIKTLIEVFDLDSSLVHAVRSEELGQAAKRPSRAGLKTARIHSIVDGVFRSYRENLVSLKDYLVDPARWARTS